MLSIGSYLGPLRLILDLLGPLSGLLDPLWALLGPTLDLLGPDFEPSVGVTRLNTGPKHLEARLTALEADRKGAM